MTYGYQEACRRKGGYQAMNLKSFHKAIHAIEELYIDGDVCECVEQLQKLQERIEKDSDNEN